MAVITTKATDQYASRPVADTLRDLGTDAAAGLSTQEAQRRAGQFGLNEIPEKEEPAWHRVFRRFWGPIPWMIEIAAILSALVHKWEDLAIILVMLLVNVVLDFLQEHRALNALRALKSRLARTVVVLRDGSFRELPARDLVPGDIIKLRIGNIVPADVQLVSGDYLLADQSMLTGESLPVSKVPGDIAYANTVIKQGDMLAVAVNTGSATRFHSVVALVVQAGLRERSHFQRMVIQIGNFLILITVVLVLVVVLAGLFRHEPFLEIARFALVLTVAAIPVALPAVLSVTMAVGALNLARRQAIVSRLSAIEELAGVDIFCADKTGTLTCNHMQAAEPVVLPPFSERDLFITAALASRRENNDPIEAPIFEYLEARWPGNALSGYATGKFVAFDPVHKRTEAEVTSGEGSFTAVKGAPQVLIQMSQLDDDQAGKVAGEVESLASRGYRTLAVGRREGKAPLRLVGLIPLYDPPRDDSGAVIKEMRSYGVGIKMITGDNLAIAREIGRILGLQSESIRASQLAGSGGEALMDFASVLSGAMYRRLKGEVSSGEARRFADAVMETVRANYDTRVLEREFIRTHESAVAQMIEQAEIFAEVVPEDKYRIVDTLQRAGHIVGMTGDGVNDAPALRKADCGIAVSGATDAARAAADIILTAPGLTVINDAIKQARVTFERMKSYATFRIAETIRIICFMTLSILVFNFYPITALMIILLALLNDVPILAIAYDNTRIDRSPVRWRMPELLTVSSVLGLSGVLSSFLLYFILRELEIAADVVQTLLFLKLIIAGHSTLYITRVEGGFWRRPWPAPLLLGATFGTELIGTLMAVYGVFVPAVGWNAALWIWVYALGWFVVNDMVKIGTFALLRRHESWA